MEDFLGTIKAFGFNFAPRGWAKCDGQLLSIAANTALFSLLGTTYGGDGITTFALPDLRGRSMLHVGQGPGLSDIRWGQRGGAEDAYMTILNLPSHSHSLVDTLVNVRTNTVINTASNGGTNEPDTGNNFFGSGGAFPNIYSEPPVSQDNVGGVTSVSHISGMTTNTGGNLPIEIRNPYLGVCICIAMIGIFPSRG
ncbi:phage tail protein [Flavobacterium salilacus subsp. salilacus]|uniref:phage tail protein n=1 Tax=Flavobacterium TaxID=237 RepID=UPI001074BD47|nr:MULTISPECIES: tail fiber protein [Flavobacterium]KAF2517458.1 phage tail protein [Flavobacterium salilacus subsp. salilacus]MBE1615602.1 phage tail protein [Flavobacterium sp. SaA2.13]